MNSDGLLQLLLREGDSVSGQQIRNFEVFRLVRGSQAQRRAFDQEGQVALRAFLADGTRRRGGAV